MNEADITVIGAGVVGLAIATELASQGREVFVIEKNESFGQETSSRKRQVSDQSYRVRKMISEILSSEKKVVMVCPDLSTSLA